MYYLVIFIIGTMIGSFLNVVIYRLPLGQSVILPSSSCTQCQHELGWYELIPIISFFIQRAKCRHCGAGISIQYPLVELFSGLLYLAFYNNYGLNSQLIIALCFSTLLVPISVIDLQHQIIPDKLNMVGAILGLMAIPISNISIASALSGALAGCIIMLLIAVISCGGMGGGDIKMIVMMGLFLGWKFTFLALFLSFVIGGLGSLLLILCRIKQRKDFIPFGPFLAIGGFMSYVFGNEILAWYFKTFFT